MTPEGCRKLAGGVSHRLAIHLHSSPGRGDRFSSERVGKATFPPPLAGRNIPGHEGPVVVTTG
jgi:hypothetical protein